MSSYPILFEALAPSLQGVVYLRLSADARLLRVGADFDLTASHVEKWIAALTDVRDRMNSRLEPPVRSPQAKTHAAP